MAPKPTPTCKKCFKNTVVWADAGVIRSIPYLYCRTCKIEVNQFGYPITQKANKLDELELYLQEQLIEKNMDLEELEIDWDDDDTDLSAYPFAFRMTP